MIFLLYKVNNYMPIIHVSFCHTSKPCANFKNPILEALRVQVLNGLLINKCLLCRGGGGKSGWGMEGVWFYFKT